MTPEETARTVWLVLVKIGKFLGLVTIGLVGLGLLVAGSIWLYTYFDYERPKSEVIVEVSYKKNDKICDQQHPVFVGVVNRSDRTILSYSFGIEARMPGYSNNLADWERYSNDKIIRPGEGWGNCWRVKDRSSSLHVPKYLTEENLEVVVVDFRPRFE